ncbi:hypothetical protein CASFOL_033779 [Castilleja foliolosa]|uniref:Peptidase A1 domain-containing protein n=1 Tax=Castilleja foliolosa TaxID=1961234 RepID=A0ABD3BYT1_9LAMI
MALLFLKSITILIAHVSLLLILSFISLSETTSTNNNNINNNTGLTIDLHHLLFTPTSPQYNPSLSHSQRVAIALTRSSFNRRLLASSSQATLTITNPSGTYYVNYFIGNSRVPTSGILDTASDLIWTPCNSKVKPLTLLKCGDSRCKSYPETTCKGDTMSSCTYSTTYGDKSSSKGTLFTGTIAFSGTGGPQIDNAVFGCASEKTGGVVGLGGGAVSLVRQFRAEKLGFCLASFNKGTSKLYLGDNAVAAGGIKGTIVIPLIKDNSKPTFYKVWVNTITIGKTPLNLNGKMLIDTGTTKTMFPKYFYNNFRKAVIALVNNNKKIVRAPDGLDSDLCYSEAPKFNGITVEFGNKAQLTWKPENMFLQFDKKLWCFVAGISTIEDSITGSASLTNFFVGLDLQKNTATFQPKDCGGTK